MSWTGEHRWWLPPAVAGLFVGLWQTAAAWGAGVVNGDDTMAQLVRNDAGLALLTSGRGDGWFPGFMLGHQLFLFFGPGFTAAVGVVRLASLGMVSTAGAYKAVGILSVALLPAAAMFLGRSLGLSRAASAAGGILTLVVDNPFGLGLHGTYVIGLVPHQLAASFFCLALGALARSVDDPRRRWITLGAAALAAVGLTHLITAVVLAVFLVILIVTRAVLDPPSLPGIGRVITAGVAAILLTGFWAIPLIAHRDLQGPITAWATPPISERLADLADGSMLWPSLMSVIALAGIATAAWLAARGLRWGLFLAASPLGYLVIAHLVAVHSDSPVSLQLANRGLGYAGLIAMVAAGAVIAAPLEALAERRRPGSATGLGPTLAATAIAVVVAVTIGSPNRSVVGTYDSVSPDLAATASRLRVIVPEGARFATERDFPAEIVLTGIPHPDIWLAAVSGRATLNLFNPESSPTDAGFAVERVGHRSAAASADTLAGFGVTHVVALREDTAERLSASPRFELDTRHGEITIFSIHPRPGRPEPESLVAPVDPDAPMEARLLEWSADRFVVEASTSVSTEVAFAVSWTPKWKVEVDGQPVRTASGHRHVLTAEIPPGDQSKITVSFENDNWDRLGLGVSATTVAAGLAYSVSLMSRRRSRTA